MTARQSGEDFLKLARKLRDTKLSQSTAVALLDEALTWIDCLTKALGDQETELARERHGRGADFAAWAGLTAAGYPAEGETAGDGNGSHRGDVLNYEHFDCCGKGMVPSRPAGGDLVAAGLDGTGHALRPAEWQCSHCQIRFVGYRTVSGICEGCENLPPRAELATSECGSTRDGYRCNASIAHRGLAVVTHAEWRDDGTVAATWPGTRIAYQSEPPGGVVPYLAPVPDLADGGAR